MKLQTAKGTKDYLPEDMIQIDGIMQKLKVAFEAAGFNPMSTPLIERFDVLSAKYAGGSEILKETFRLQDQGKRDLGLRYDLTVPFARVIGSNPQLKFPFKRYQMEKVYRDGPVGPGRYREFWQCDIDVVGAKSMKAEAELLTIVSTFFASVELQANIQVNNRKVLDGLFANFKAKDLERTMLTVDKWLKIGKDGVLAELIANGEDESAMNDLVNLLESFAGSNEEKLNRCTEILGEKNQAVLEITELLTLCKTFGANVAFNPLLARGLSYYTGTIMETILIDNDIKGTVSAGGRYDNLIGNFIDSKQPYPAVGFTFGVSRIYDALVAAKKMDIKKSVTKALIISMKQDVTAANLTKELRAAGINVEMDIMNRNMRKNLDYANALGIPFALILGEDEVTKGVVMVKDLVSGSQEELSVSDVIKKLH
jgi:histidyl-tRNA synthetase